MSTRHPLLPAQTIETMRAMLAGLDGLSGAEVVILYKKSLEIEARRNEIKSCQINDYAGVGIRLQRGQKIAQSFATHLEVNALKGALDRCHAMLGEIPDDPLTDLSPMIYKDEATYGNESDRSFGLIPVEEKCNRLINLERNVLRFDKRIKAAMGVTYSERQVREWIWTMGSRRTLLSESTHAKVQASAVAYDEVSSQFATAFDLQSSYFDLDWGQVARSAAAQSLLLLNAKPLAVGKHAAVFSPQVMMELLELLAQAFAGSRVMEGSSFLRDTWGQELFSKEINLIDDPFMKKQAGSRAWDTEGTPVRKQFLVDRGIIANFLWSKRSAKQAGRVSSGNAVRISERHQPEDGFHNLYLEPGIKDTVDLLRQMQNGVWVQRIMGLSSFDPASGNISLMVSGLYVQGGEVLHAIDGAVLVSTMPRLLARATLVGRDLKWSHRVGSPSVLFESLHFC